MIGLLEGASCLFVVFFFLFSMGCVWDVWFLFLSCCFFFFLKFFFFWLVFYVLSFALGLFCVWSFICLVLFGWLVVFVFL